MVPMIVPATDMQGGGSSAWGDVASYSSLERL